MMIRVTVHFGAPSHLLLAHPRPIFLLVLQHLVHDSFTGHLHLPEIHVFELIVKEHAPSLLLAYLLQLLPVRLLNFCCSVNERFVTWIS